MKRLSLWIRKRDLDPEFMVFQKSYGHLYTLFYSSLDSVVLDTQGYNFHSLRHGRATTYFFRERNFN